jgi:hypothetical protein
VRRLAIALGLSLGLLGCGGQAARLGPTVPVALLTSSLGCWAGGESGPTAPLVVDLTYGTSFGGRPVMWPGGYTARRVGGEVVVLDAHGNVKATTGRMYHISYAYTFAPYQQVYPSPNAFPAAVDCGYPWDFIDCTDAASAPPGSPADKYC